MEALVPGYLKKLEKHVKAGKMFYFAVLPLGEYNNYTTDMKPEDTLILEKYLTREIKRMPQSHLEAHCLEIMWEKVFWRTTSSSKQPCAMEALCGRPVFLTESGGYVCMYLTREEGYVGGSMLFFYFIEHYKELLLNQCGLCMSLFQGYYQLVVAVFKPRTKLPNTVNFASISEYTAEFKIVKALAIRCVDTILSTILRLKQPGGTYNYFTVGATLDSDARDDDYENFLVYLADSELEPLPNPDPELNFGTVEYGLMEALIIFLCKIHPLLASLITNEIGGSDQIKEAY